MIAYDDAQMAQWVKEARESADRFDYEWDLDAVNWPLRPDSVVFEVGSFKGRWALQIAQRYSPRLYCFEPQRWAYEVTRQVLAGFNAQVFNFGLGERDAAVPMGLHETDSCSFVASEGLTAVGELRDIADVLPELGVTEIDLMMVNIEGYEYTLLPYMMVEGIKPRWLMVQCHGTSEGYGRLVRLLLGNGYSRLWDYGMMLSAWELNRER